MYYDVYCEHFVKRKASAFNKILYYVGFVFSVLLGILAALISIGTFAVPFILFVIVTYYRYTQSLIMVILMVYLRLTRLLVKREEKHLYL